MAGERFSPRETARIGLAVAEALAEAHHHHVLHRDLKPDNVLVPPDGRPRVLDFGLARHSADAPPLSEPAPQSEAPRSESRVDIGNYISDEGLVGTPRYMAPEQWAAADPGSAVDVWALGLILYELASGRHPYEGLSYEELCFAVYENEPVPPMANGGALPQLLVDLIMNCVAKKAALRPSAAEVVAQLRGFLHFGRARLDEGESPFRGLLTFTERHANAFFGREAEIDRFIEQLRNQAVLALVGLSGAGKSSLVRAGVIPRLRDKERWMVVRMRPGSRPFKTLAHHLIAAESESFDSKGPPPRDSMESLDEDNVDVSDTRALADALEREPGRLALQLRALATQHQGKVMLFVDQLEELVTLNAGEKVRARFMAALCRAADEPLDPVRVVMAVRDDFLSRLMMIDEARQALGNIFIMQRPGSEALEATLRDPIAAAGYAYDDPALPTEMVAAVCHEPACLPLLQFAAQQLWENRDSQDRLLLRSAYDAMGGVEGALAKRADGVLEALSGDELSSARQLLLRLVTVERTRKVAAQHELLEGLGDEAVRVLERLTDARLVTKRKQLAVEHLRVTVELAHESLITRWDTLRRWLDEGEDDLVFLAEVSQAAELWKKRGKRDDELWQGEALADARRILDKSNHAIPTKVERFIAAAKHKQARRSRLRRVAVSAMVGALTIVVLVLAWQNYRVEQKHAEAQFQRAQAQQQRGRAEQKQAEALVEGARAAWSQGNALEARAKLRLALTTADTPSVHPLWWQLRDEPLLWQREVGAFAYGVAFSPDGETLAIACQNKSVYLVDVKTRALSVLRGHTDQVGVVGFRRDGKVLASGDWAGTVRIWDVQTGRQLHTLSGHDAAVWGVSFSPDGNLLATSDWGGKTQLWNARTGKPKRIMSTGTGGSGIVSFSPDGSLLAISALKNTVRLLDARTGEVKHILSGHGDRLTSSSHSARSVSFSPDGKVLASGAGDATVRLWDVQTGQQTRVLIGHSGGVRSVSFGPKGDFLASATGNGDNSVRIWNARTGEPVLTLPGHPGGVLAVSFSPDGRTVASGGRDMMVRLWDTRSRKSAHRLSGHTAAVMGLSFSRDGAMIASASMDNSVRLWDTRTGDVKAVLSGHATSAARVLSVSFSPDGRLLASGSTGRTVRLWDTASGQIKRTLIAENSAHAAEFSPDGTALAVSNGEHLWDPHTGKHARALSAPLGDQGLDFSPDGRWLASASWEGTVQIVDVRGGGPSRSLVGHTAPVMGVTFTPDGQRLATGSYDKTVRVWDVPTGRETLLLKQPARAYWLDFHPDGRRLGVPCSDGVARIWDIETKKVVTELRGHSSEVNYLRFSGDGKFAATSSDDTTVRLWDVSTGIPVWRAPLLLASPPRLLSHRGWLQLTDAADDEQPKPKPKNQVEPKKWERAVEQRARHAAATPDGKRLCMQSFDGDLELWSLQRDRLVTTQRVAGLEDLRALPDGCLVRISGADGGSAKLFRPKSEAAADVVTRMSATELLTTGRVSAIGTSGAELFVAAGKQIFVFDVHDRSGKASKHLQANVGITTIARIDAGHLALGYANGNVEFVSAGTRAAGKPDKSKFSLERTPSSVVTRIVAGPMGTLIVGYGSGFVGMWSMRDGKLLADDRIHGPVEHLLLEKRKLYAASSLGQHLVWDLSTLYATRCDVLREVWQRVPVVWKDGRAVLESPPPGHVCMASATAE
jgi:WD40 repeat protein